MKDKSPRLRTVLRRFLFIAACGLALLLSGCGLEEFVLWAPDGSHALVKGNSSNYLVRADGTILGKLPENEGWLENPWMPDSQRIIVVRTVKTKSLEEYLSLIGEDRTEAAYEAASRLLKALQKHEGKLDDFPFDKHVELADRVSAAYLEPEWPKSLGVVFACMADKYPQETVDIFRKFNQFSQTEPEKGELDLPIYELVVRNLLPFGGPASEQILFRSPDEIRWVRSSPRGDHIAFVRLEPVRPALYTVPAAGGNPPVRVDEGTMQADWSADGRYLAYAKTRLPFLLVRNETQLGTITRRVVLGQQGEELPELPEAEDLAGTLYNIEGRVAYLPDGRILFASAELSLPATPDAGGNVSLYALRAGETTTIESLVRPEMRSNLPNRADRFALSPDGKHVAMTGDIGGEVTVLSLETGKLVTLQQKVAAWSDRNHHTEFRPAPTWRSATELCYIAPAGLPFTSPRRSEIVLHSLSGTPRALSKSWPDQMGKFLRGNE